MSKRKVKINEDQIYPAYSISEYGVEVVDEIRTDEDVVVVLEENQATVAKSMPREARLPKWAQAAKRAG